jgi:two-component system CitB family sensor kinase
LSLLVKDPIIAGFLIGERQKFSEVKTKLQIEIFPEIPLNNSEERTELITIYRYIHYAFLQRKLPETLNLSIELINGMLITTYTFNNEDILQNEWFKIKESLHSFYFKQLLNDSQSQLIFKSNSLVLHSTYLKEDALK